MAVLWQNSREEDVPDEEVEVYGDLGLFLVQHLGKAEAARLPRQLVLNNGLGDGNEGVFALDEVTKQRCGSHGILARAQKLSQYRVSASPLPKTLKQDKSTALFSLAPVSTLCLLRKRLLRDRIVFV